MSVIFCYFDIEQGDLWQYLYLRRTSSTSHPVCLPNIYTNFHQIFPLDESEIKISSRNKLKFYLVFFDECKNKKVKIEITNIKGL